MSRRDMKVKWNSWYIMMNWFIDEIKQIFQLYIINENIQDDKINATDWLIFRNIRNFLKSFYRRIKEIENRFATINRIFSVLNYLFDRFDDAMYDFANNDFMKLFFEIEHDKLKKYWNKSISRTFVYVVVLILNFTQKWCYFEKHWNAKSIIKTKISFTKIWNTYNHIFFFTTNFSFSKENESSNFIVWMYRNREHRQTNELNQYFSESLDFNRNLNVIDWWLNQKTRLSTLIRMILNIFNISSMSFESKRIFFSLKHMITTKRISLIFKIIETLKCIKNWMKIDIFIDEKLIVVLILIEKMKKTHKKKRN